MAGSEALTLKLWVVLSRAQAAIEAHARRDVARHGLTLTEFGILEALLHKGPMQLGEVQKKILVSSGGITYLVDKLEKRGLVERQESPSDRRARYAALTPEGEALICRVFREHVSALENALSGLCPEEKALAIDLLRRLGRHAAELDISDPAG